MFGSPMISYCTILFVASAVAEVTNINSEIDSYLEDWNQQIRNSKDTIFGIEADMIGNNIRYSEGYLYGLDSLQRIGDCTSSKRQNSTSYDCRFGLRMLLLAFPRVEIAGKAMSLSARVWNNSFHLGYTVVKSGNMSKDKYVVEAYEVETFQDVELGASDPAFDGKDVEDFFVRTVRPIVDSIAKETLDPEDSSEEDHEASTSSEERRGSAGGWLQRNFLHFQRSFIGPLITKP